MHTSRLSFSGMRLLGENVTITEADVPQQAAVDEDTRSFDEGFQAGVQQAQEEAQAVLQGQQEQIEALQAQVAHLQMEIPNSINEYLHELERQAKEECVELAFAAAEAVARREIDRESPVRAVLTEALQMLTHLNEIKLMLSPQDYAMLQGTGEVPPGIEMVQDAQLMPGEIFLESPQGFLDGKVHTRLAELRSRFLELLNQMDADNDSFEGP